MSEWRMTDKQIEAAYEEASCNLAWYPSPGSYRVVEAAVRLGIVVPAQDGEGIKASAWRSSFLSVKAIIDEIGIILGGNVGDEVTVRGLARQRMAELEALEYSQERLRAVRELHAPLNANIGYVDEYICSHCSSWGRSLVAYPCPTIAALETRPREENPK